MLKKTNKEIDSSRQRDLGRELFDSDKFRDVIEEIIKKRYKKIIKKEAYAKIAERLNISYGILRDYISKNSRRCPSVKNYKEIYTNIRKIYQDPKGEVIDKFYFSNKKSISQLDLQQLLYIQGYLIEEIKESGEITASSLNFLLYRNASLVIYDGKIIESTINGLATLLKSKCNKINYKLLDGIFLRDRNSKHRLVKDKNFIDYFSLLNDLKVYIEDNDLLPDQLPDKIFDKLEITVSTITIERLTNKARLINKEKVKDKEKFKNTDIMTPKIFVILRDFLLEGDIEEEDRLLAYTRYKSIESMSLNELIYVSGYALVDIAKKFRHDYVLGNVSRLRAFLFVKKEHNLSDEETKKTLKILAEKIEVSERDVTTCYERDKYNRDTINRENYEARNKGKSIIIEKDKGDIVENSRKGKDIISDIDESLEYESESSDINTSRRNENDIDTINSENYETCNKGKSIVVKDKKAIISSIYNLIEDVSRQNTQEIRLQNLELPIQKKLRSSIPIKRKRDTNIIQEEIKDIIFSREQNNKKRKRKDNFVLSSDSEDSIFIGENSSNRSRRRNFVLPSDSEDSENSMEDITHIINNNSTNKRLINIGGNARVNITVNKNYYQSHNKSASRRR